MLNFTGERIVPQADNCEPLFALKMYQEHTARYLFAAQASIGKRVLDVGCGVGYGAHLLALSGAASVTAFDIAEPAIRHAREFYAHPKVEYLVSSAEDFTFSGSFDVVTCFELIEHVNHQLRTVERIARVLRPDGLLIMSTPRPVGGHRSAFHTRELQFNEFTNLLKTHFEHVEFFFENNHFTSLVASGQPHTIERIHTLHPQFNLGQSDYFVAVASQAGIDASQFRAQLVLNNDDYVRNLERDVDILHRIEDDLKARIAAINEENASVKAQLAAERDHTTVEEATFQDQTTKLLRELNSVRAETDALRTQLSTTQAGASLLRRQLETAQEEASLLRRELETASMETARQTASEIDACRIAAQQESAVWRQRATDQQILLDSLRRQIDEVHNSRSWRITAPLRSGLDVLFSARRWMRTASNGRESSPRSISQKPFPAEAPSPAQAPAGFRGKTYFDVLYVIGCHEGESKRYRVFNLVEGLTELGYQATSILDQEIPELLRSDVRINTVVLFRIGDTAPAREIIAWSRLHNVALVFDVDDLVFEPESIDGVRVVQTFSSPERAEYLRGVEQYQKMLLSADFVTCPTAFLAGRVEQLGKRAAVIPNSLNRRQIDAAERLHVRARAPNGVVRLGYFSGSNTHQVDFQACEIALLSIMDRHPECRFVLGGILDLDARWDAYGARVERLPLMSYEPMLEALSRVDINLAPLEVGNPYCEGKSQLKIFEAGVVGVPTVASDTTSYREAIDHGLDGFLAADETAWRDALERLITDPEGRNRMGARARARSLHQFSPAAAAKAAVQAYGFMKAGSAVAAAPPVRNDRADAIKISWIIPGLIIGGGGHRNILRAAYHLHQFGHEIELYFTNTDQTEEQLAEAVRTHFYPLYCPMHVYRGSIRPADVLFATHWSTVDAAVRARAAVGEIMYFVQDFEPAFAPMGTEYVLAENTYRLGLYHITSGPWCERFLKEQFHCEADHFLFPVDTAIYHPRPRVKPEPNIVFFAKPEMPRRCFELGVMALEEVHRLRPDIEIVLFGSRNADAQQLSFPAAVRSLLPTIEDLALLYANADVGLVFSTTNPSLVPYEMMACGLPVVDLDRPGNEINYDERRDIALLADPAPAKMARQICNLLDDAEERADRSRRGLEFIKRFPSEQGMARRIEDLILRRLAARGYAARSAPAEMNV